ncbi:MAG: hypothetical protein ACKV2O_19080 [Acidimicrobiales bacterium]
MSSLWTPGGEHPVGPSRARPAAASPTEPPEHLQPPPEPPERELSEEEAATLADAAAEIAQIRDQLAATPAELVVANHIMGLYELAAIHLNVQEPNLDAARLAIDALGAVLDRCKGRLGEPEATLVDARAQLQMAFVRVSEWATGPRD